MRKQVRAYIRKSGMTWQRVWTHLLTSWESWKIPDQDNAIISDMVFEKSCAAIFKMDCSWERLKWENHLKDFNSHLNGSIGCLSYSFVVEDEIQIPVPETYWRLNLVSVWDDIEGNFSKANNVLCIQGEKKVRISWVGKQKHWVLLQAGGWSCRKDIQMCYNQLKIKIQVFFLEGGVS